MKNLFKVAGALCLLFIFAAGSHAQTGKIVGRVIDATMKQEMIGANVQVTGTTLGAVTDVRGNYTITGVPAGSHQLKVTFIGYQTAEG